MSISARGCNSCKFVITGRIGLRRCYNSSVSFQGKRNTVYPAFRTANIAVRIIVFPKGTRKGIGSICLIAKVQSKVVGTASQIDTLGLMATSTISIRTGKTVTSQSSLAIINMSPVDSVSQTGKQVVTVTVCHLCCYWTAVISTRLKISITIVKVQINSHATYARLTAILRAVPCRSTATTVIVENCITYRSGKIITKIRKIRCSTA